MSTSPEKERAAAIIVQASKVLLIHRRNQGRDYYVLPGGGIEVGEDPVTACIREICEETGLTISIDSHICTFVNQKRTEHYFLVRHFDGSPALGGAERQRHSLENQYYLEWIHLAEIANIGLHPQEIYPYLQNISS